tara:strand:- start:730 stop:1410 length:681 start_codon:yes stop_codon:yes gene_type:complete
MKIVILAAGIGSRLGNSFPKPLTTLINGKSIMKMQIDNIITKYNIDDIIVVVGYKKDLIMESFPNLNFIYNSLFDRNNTSKSLLKALKKYPNEKVLWLNGDVVFDKRIFELIDSKIQSNQTFVAVNTNEVGKEEIKYTLKNGYINELSKEVENGLGEAVGINFISSKDIKKFIKRLEECNNNDYFERGLELAIQKDNLEVIPIDISKYKCIEIDFIEDLDNVNKML